MAPETLTDYERRRQENIRRNAKMMETLKLQSTAADLSPFKPRRHHHKKPPPSSVRRSLRARGLSPQRFIPQITNLSDFIAIPSSDPPPTLLQPVINAQFDPRSLMLRPENSTVVLPKIISSIRFLPFSDRTVVVAGNAVGSLGLWVADSPNGAGMCSYCPHSSVITGISAHYFSAAKIFTSSYDRSIRLMDAEKENSNVVVCSSNAESFHSICQSPQDSCSLYIGEGEGKLKVWDERTGKASSFWLLHDRRINTIDFSSRNAHLAATSSSDGTACIWDLRLMKKEPECLKRVVHQRAVHSVYFSPSGSCVATTSDDDTIGILSGANFEDQVMLSHKNRGVKLLSPSRGMWGWDDSHLFVGNLEMGIDIIFTGNKTTMALESSEMNATPQRLALHPYRLGYLATAISGGKVFLWTKD